MAQKVQSRRCLTLAILLCLAFVGLGYRLVDLQILRHEDLAMEARRYREHEFFRQPCRGDILDAKGNILSTNMQKPKYGVETPLSKIQCDRFYRRP